MKKSKTNKNQYIHSFYKGNKISFVFALFFHLLKIPLNLMISWLLGAVIDAITSEELSQLWRLLIFAAILIVVFLITDLLSPRIRSKFIHTALEQYKSLAFKNLSAKSINAFARENTGRYISVLTNDVNTIEEKYLTNLFDLVYYPLIFAGALVMMFTYSPTLTLVTVILSVFCIAVSMLSANTLTAREKEVSNKNEQFVSQIKDLLTDFAVIKSFKAEQEVQKLYNSSNHLVEDAKRRRLWVSGIVTAASNCAGIILQLGSFFIGAYLAIRGSITAGTVIVFVQMGNYIINPIASIPKLWAECKAAIGLVDKLAEVTEKNPEHTGDTIEPILKNSIEFKNLTFGYDPAKPILKNLSLSLKTGKKYALVGASGSGKSTLLNLLMGGYSDYSGSITIDGKELSSIDTNSLYDLMSLIGQNVFLFDNTIERNITMFREFPREKIESAEKRSGLAELINQKGESYRCGENGVNLSGGERQRISIARCLLRGTPVLLLDEATAALDNSTSFAITNEILCLDELTRIVVTHRLEAALLKQYDEIIVLRDGCIQEFGTFHELMARKKYFYSLYTVAGN